MKLKFVILLILVAAIGWYFYGKESGKGKQAKGGAPITVALATAKTGNINIYLGGLGNVTPPNTITVHSMVNGELMSLPLEEGQFVKKEQLLAQIDDRPYVAALEQAEGQLKRDQALLDEAKIDLKRYATLVAQDSLATQQLDLQRSLVKQYEGTVLNDKGLVDAAKTNLIYTKITAPVGGRVGLRQVDPGNIVHTTDTNGVIVITQLQPITVIFTLPEDNIPQVQVPMENGKLVAEAWDRDNKNKLAEGSVYAIDNEIDPTTGMVKLRAEFPNEDNKLFPDQFVNVRCLVQTKENVVIMPAAAVQHGSNGTFVYLAQQDDTVTVQNVKIDVTEGDNVSVSEGIKAGDQVVVDGADNLREGSKIVVPSQAAATAANASSPDTKDGKDNKDKKHKHKKDKDGDAEKKDSE